MGYDSLILTLVENFQLRVVGCLARRDGWQLEIWLLRRHLVTAVRCSDLRDRHLTLDAPQLLQADKALLINVYCLGRLLLLAQCVRSIHTLTDNTHVFPWVSLKGGGLPVR